MSKFELLPAKKIYQHKFAIGWVVWSAKQGVIFHGKKSECFSFINKINKGENHDN